MQNKLQYLIPFLTAILFLFVIHGFTSLVYSQVVLSDDRTQEILFTDQNSSETQSSTIISLNSYERILSGDLNLEEANWIKSESTSNQLSYRYIQSLAGNVLAGEIQIEGFEEIIQNAFSLKNNSSNPFGTLNISTDFVIKNVNSSDEISLVLRLKNSEGLWVDAGKGVFYPDTEKDEQTFSVQITISDIFIGQNRTVDLMWVNRSDSNNNHELYTQGIEISPQYADLLPLNRGDLLISELMPIGNIDGFEFEYLELYNPDGFKKSLKGVTIQTDFGSHTIQNESVIPPYGFYIISNADFSDVQNVDYSYFYPGDRLFSKSESSGRVEIAQNGRLIASALYEFAEQNVSFEIKRMSQSVDGYTGLQNLGSAVNTFTTDVYGSPGEEGNSLTVYNNTYTDPGVYLIALPGQIYSNTFRVVNTSFYSVDGRPVQLTETEPFEPLFMIKQNSDPLTISVEGFNATDNERLSTFNSGTHQYISPVKPGVLNLDELYKGKNSLLPNVLGVWDRIENRVVMEKSDEAVTEIWTPVISRIVSDEDFNSRSAAQMPLNLENSFRFSFLEVRNDEEHVIDEVWVEVKDDNRPGLGNMTPSYFTKPVFTINEELDFKNPEAVLYGNYTEINESGLSYFNVFADNSSFSEFSLGIFGIDVREQRSASLKWIIPNNIPEDWSVVLTDRVTGQEVNMMNENSYTFRIEALPENKNDDNSDKSEIRQLDIKPVNIDRFTVRFEPPNLAVTNDEESETPGEIELRQNYPNPFNPSTNITFSLPEDRQVRLGIYNIVGQQVATLIDDNLGAGEHSVVWNASNNPSGIYIVQLETESRILTRKITLVK